MLNHFSLLALLFVSAVLFAFRQAEIFVSDEARERQNLIYHRPSVIEQVREKAMDMGFRGDLLERNVAEIASDDDRIIKFLYSGEEDDEDSR